MKAQERPAGYSEVQALAAAAALDEPARRRAEALAGLDPEPAALRDGLGRFLLAVGVLLILAGVAAFFAANWSELGRLGRFGLVQAGVVLAAGLALWRGLDTLAGRAALFAAAFLVGVLLVVFGQTYQTGADPYGLFLAWALLILPLALIGRQAPLWMLELVLANLALILFWIQVLRPPAGWWELAQLLGPLVWLVAILTDAALAGWVFALNAAALVLWERLAGRRGGWMSGRTLPRLAASLALACALAPTLLLIIGVGFNETGRMTALPPLLLGGLLASGGYYYLNRRRDLFMLTCGAFAAICVVMTAAVKLVTQLFSGELGLLLLAALLILQVSAATIWLRGVARRWEVGA